MRFIFLGLFYLCTQFSVLLAQTPVLKFLNDSVLVGDQVKAVLYYKHDSNEEIIFPDSNYNFKPFEFVGKQYFPTNSSGGQSIDSAIYTFTIFEIEGSHSLTLPVLTFRGKDTLKVFSSSDSISIKPIITVETDSLKLKSNTQLFELESEFNYQLLGIVIGFLLCVGLAIYLILGKNIFEQIRKYRRKLAHERFLKLYDEMVNNAISMTPQKMEDAVSLWKKYIEALENKPYTTYTSSEIGHYLKNESIKKNLQNIDVAIYSGRVAEVASNDFAVLREEAIRLYIKRQSTTSK
jgi:hypothetical protein